VSATVDTDVIVGVSAGTVSIAECCFEVGGVYPCRGLLAGAEIEPAVLALGSPPEVFVLVTCVPNETCILVLYQSVVGALQPPPSCDCAGRSLTALSVPSTMPHSWLSAARERSSTGQNMIWFDVRLEPAVGSCLPARGKRRSHATPPDECLTKPPADPSSCHQPRGVLSALCKHTLEMALLLYWGLVTVSSNGQRYSTKDSHTHSEDSARTDYRNSEN